MAKKTNTSPPAGKSVSNKKMKNDKESKTENNSIGDLLGIKPVADSMKIAVTKSFEGIEGFLKRVSLPLLDEIGFLLRDKVRFWRLQNVLKVLEKSQGKLIFNGEKEVLTINPRIAIEIIEEASKVEEDEIQEMWAGLFAASCNENGYDDSNIIFVNLLKQLTSVEVRILNHACENTTRIIHLNGLITGHLVKVTFNELVLITGVDDVHVLDRALDHLSSLGLIGVNGIIQGGGGFDASDEYLWANISPSALALNLHARCSGFKGVLSSFKKDKIITDVQFKDLKTKEHIENP